MTEKQPNVILKAIIEFLSSPGTEIYSADFSRGYYEKLDPKNPWMTTKVPSDIMTVVVHVAPKAKRRRPRLRK